MPSDDTSSEGTLVSPYGEISSDEMSEGYSRDSCLLSSSSWASSDGWPASVVPGCSKRDGRAKPWTMTTTMMQTYITMKGREVDAQDPLLRFLSRQEEHGTDGIVMDMKRCIKEQLPYKIEGPTTFSEDERLSASKYRRAKVDHLYLDDSLDPDLLEAIYENHDDENDGWREVASDISDDEGGPETGRISPCTFACWAQGSKRWDEPGDKYDSIYEPRKEYEIPDVRQRPPSPNTLEPRATKYRYFMDQEDDDDGGGAPLTPGCSEFAMTEPSILWSPPPMRAKLPYHYYNRAFERMDPKLAKALREGVATTAGSFGFCSTCDTPSVSLEVSKTEEDRVVSTYIGLTQTNKKFAKLQDQLRDLRKNADEINAANECFRHEATRLRHENRKLTDCLAFHGSIRERRILQQVDKRLRALKFEAQAKADEVSDQYKENTLLRNECVEMRLTQDKLLEYFGKKKAEEVFAMFPHVWKPLEVRKNRRNLSA